MAPSRNAIKLPLARRDLEELAFHIAQDNQAAGFRFLEAAERALELLVTMPEIGSLWETGSRQATGLRFWPIRGFPKHLIFYRPLENGIEVVRVLHASRDLESLI